MKVKTSGRQRRSTAQGIVCSVVATCLMLATPSAWPGPAQTSVGRTDRPSRLLAARTGTTPQEAGHTNIIRTSRSAVAPIEVPRQTWIDATFTTARHRISESLSVKGRGRIVGILLTRDPLPRPFDYMVFAARVAACQEPGCAPEKGRMMTVQNPGSWDANPTGDERILIGPGRYRLYVIADGAPIKVTLRLPGLQGKKVLQPGAPMPIDMTPPELQANELAGPSVFSAGNTYERGDFGMLLATLFIESDEPSHVAKGICHYPESKPPAALPHGPHCLAANGGGNVGLTEVAEDGYRFFYINVYDKNTQYEQTGDGSVGLGAWVHSPFPLRHVAAQMMTAPLGG